MMLSVIFLLLLAMAESSELRRKRRTRSRHDLVRMDVEAIETIRAYLEEDFHHRTLADEFSLSMNIETTDKPTSQPSTSSTGVLCDPGCPCCQMPEFVRTIEAFSDGNSCQQDCCSLKDEPAALFLVDCKSPITPGYNVAYMSYNTDGRIQCGDSAFSDPLWIIITEEEAAACEALIRSKIDDTANCNNDEWPCN